MLRRVFIVALAAAIGGILPSARANAAPNPGNVVFAFSGATQQWTVPQGVNAIDVELLGAQGGGMFGGLGARMRVTLTVTPGAVLQVNVGGAGTQVTNSTSDANGGFNGGGAGSRSGGGATDVRMGGTALTNRVLVAGGGGGGSNDPVSAVGGSAGAPNGEDGGNGVCNAPGTPGTGATEAAPGHGAVTLGQNFDGSFGSGGSSAIATGGGGGGWYGGGAGASGCAGDAQGGGGGGSSHAGAGTSNVQLQKGWQFGNGLVRFAWPTGSMTDTAGAGGEMTFVANDKPGVYRASTTTVDVDLYGAGGDGPYGGFGGRVRATVPVALGQPVLVLPGGAPRDNKGGWNGGGAMRDSAVPVGGGGATDVRIGGWRLDDRVLVAAGGGGGSLSTTNPFTTGGGSGGALVGQDGDSYKQCEAGKGGTQTAGGAANTHTGTAGAFGVGGGSVQGGGGGGWYGGGGGAAVSSVCGTGGGAGSSYSAPANQNAQFWKGVHYGDGLARVGSSSTGRADAGAFVPQSSFDLKGYAETYLAPAGTTSLDVTLAGGSGGDVEMPDGAGGTLHATGGGGGVSHAGIAVEAGTPVSVLVGGSGEHGGFAGGGHGNFGGWGGGATEVRIGGRTLADRVLVAGGGGGGALTEGNGGGGGGIGANGVDGWVKGSVTGQVLCTVPAGTGATQTTPGTGSTPSGDDGVGPIGGDSGVSGGAGGGGYLGGGGGSTWPNCPGGPANPHSSSGGGGGSSYAAPNLNASLQQGGDTGDGYARIVTDAPPPSSFGADSYGEIVANVHVGSGNVVNDVTDAKVASVGPALKVERFYNSLDTRDGLFGKGWASNLDTRADVNDGNVTIEYGDGRREVHHRQADGSFDSPKGYPSTLTSVAGGGYRLALKDKTSYTFGSRGALTAIADKYGREQRLAYRADGSLSMVTDVVSGRALHITITDGHITQVQTDPVNGAPLTWNYGYTNALLNAVCDARNPSLTNGSCTRYAYSKDVIVKITRPGGNDELRAHYDDVGRADWTENGAGNRTSFEYFGAATVVTDPNGNATTFGFDDQGRTRSIIDAQQKGTSYEYDTNGFRSKVTDANGNSYLFTFNAAGDQLTQTDPLGHTSYNTFDANHFLKEARDARSSSATDNTYRTTYTYNAAGDQLTETSPPTQEYRNGVTKTHTYTTGGLLKTENAGRGNDTVYDYDPQGNLAQRTDPTGLVTTYKYDALGREMSETATWTGGSATTTQTWTPLSMPDTVTQPRINGTGGAAASQLLTTYVYDGNANLHQQIDKDVVSGRQRLTQVDYDAADREHVKTDPEHHTVTTDYDPAGNVAQVTDGNGNVYTSSYDNRNLLSQVTLKAFVDDPIGAPTRTRDVILKKYLYDDAGRKVDEFDPAPGADRAHAVPMRQTHYDYDDDDRLLRTTLIGFHDTATKTRDVVLEAKTYDNAGNVLTDATGNGLRVVTNLYDARSTLQQSTLDMRGTAADRVTTFDYLETGQPTRTTLTDGNSVSEERWHYLPNAPLADQDIVANGAKPALVTRFAYDERGLKTLATDPRASAITDVAYQSKYDYDALGRQTAVTAPQVAVQNDGTKPATLTRPVTTSGYDAWGDQTDLVDARGNHTVTFFDGNGRQVRVNQPSYTPATAKKAIDAFEQWTYDGNGNVKTALDRRGFVTSYDYDGRNRVVRQTDPKVGKNRAGGTLLASYDDAGNQVSRTDQTGAATTASFDDLGRMRTSVVLERFPSPGTFTTTYGYDDLGNRTSTQDPTRITTTSAYDAASELVSTTNARNGTTSYTYDVAGRQTSVTDPANRKTATTFDGAGRVTQTDDYGPSGNLAGTAYFTPDAAGNVKESRTARSANATDNRYLTTSVFDGLNRLTEVDTPSAHGPVATTYGYDATGNLTRSTNGNKVATTYTYTPWNTPLSTVEPAVAGKNTAANQTFTRSYDAGGLPVNLAEPGGTKIVRTFDELGRLAKEVGSGGGATSATRAFTYDLAGRRTSFSAPTGTVTLTNNDRGRVLSASVPKKPASAASSFTYNAAGQMTARRDAAGTTTYDYSTTTGDLTAMRSPLATESLSYNPDGTPSTITYGSGSAAPKRTLTYSDLGEVASDTMAVSGATKAATSYEYYADGSMRSQTSTLPGNPQNGRSAYDYDGSGRLTSWTAPSGTTTTYGYDDAGNRTSAGNKTFVYDSRNRVTSGAGATYTYTPRGTVATKTVGATTTKYRFDGFDQQAKVGTTAYEYDALGRLTALGKTAATYAGVERDPASFGTELYARSPSGTLVATKSGSTARIAGLNAHGDVSWLAASNGTVDATAAYDPYGVPTTTGTQTALGFQADLTDPATGTVDMGARWYDPNTGQFTARDTTFGQLRTPLSLNRYTYALDDPLNRFDPDGHSPIDWVQDHIISPIANGISNGVDRISDAVHSVGSYLGSQKTPSWSTLSSWGKSAWKTVSAGWHATWSGIKTAAHTVANAASACAGSSTCRTVVAATAIVGLTVATGGLAALPEVVVAGAGWGTVGAGVGVLTCHGDTTCVTESAITFAAFGAAGPITEGLGLTGFAGGAFEGLIGEGTRQAFTGKFEPARLAATIAFTGAIGELADYGTTRIRSTAGDARTAITDRITEARATGLQRGSMSVDGPLEGKGESGFIDPTEVRFTQDSAKRTFSDGRSVADLAVDLESNPELAKTVPPIRLVEHEGSAFSLDNRRLIAFRQAGVDAPYRMATREEIDRLWPEHFTTKNSGTSIQLRLW